MPAPLGSRHRCTQKLCCPVVPFFSPFLGKGSPLKSPNKKRGPVFLMADRVAALVLERLPSLLWVAIWFGCLWRMESHGLDGVSRWQLLQPQLMRLRIGVMLGCFRALGPEHNLLFYETLNPLLHHVLGKLKVTSYLLSWPSTQVAQEKREAYQTVYLFILCPLQTAQSTYTRPNSAWFTGFSRVVKGCGEASIFLKHAVLLKV